VKDRAAEKAKEDGKLPEKKSKSVCRKYTSSVKFEPTDREKESFQIIQEQLTKNLTHHNPLGPTFVKIDASRKRGFRGMLFHIKGDDWHAKSIPVKKIEPILFLSKRATPDSSRGYGDVSSKS
jgi:hypothetical protein